MKVKMEVTVIFEITVLQEFYFHLSSEPHIGLEFKHKYLRKDTNDFIFQINVLKILSLNTNSAKQQYS